MVAGRVAAERGDSYPGVVVRYPALHGDPVTALREASVDAWLTVVGSRGARRVARVVLGSVALTIAGINPAPVAVIHPGQHPDGLGPVVVGVDTTLITPSACPVVIARPSFHGHPGTHPRAAPAAFR